MDCGAEQGLISIDEAIHKILTTAKPLVARQQPLQQSFGQYLAQAVHAQVDLPPFRQSAVDGYAISSSTITQARHFNLIAEIRAGQEQQHTLHEGQAQRIFTGAQVPENCTMVARQEIVTRVSEGEIRVESELKANADIREKGEEVAKGQSLAEVGQQLTVGAIAALSMAGIAEAMVYPKPTVAIVITGDEVAQQGEVVRDAIVYDANGPLLTAWLQQQGIQAEIHYISDQADALNDCFFKLKDKVDVILTTGGVSVGDYDLVRPCAFEQGFEQVFWKVKQKPGKPLFFAHYQSQNNPQQSCYLLGLPGNPAAVYIGVQIFAQVLLKALQGQVNEPKWISAVLQHTIKADDRERILRMSATFEQGVLHVASLAKQQSHMLSNLLQSNCLVRIPSGIEMFAGQVVQGILV